MHSRPSLPSLNALILAVGRRGVEDVNADNLDLVMDTEIMVLIVQLGAWARGLGKEGAVSSVQMRAATCARPHVHHEPELTFTMVGCPSLAGMLRSRRVAGWPPAPAFGAAGAFAAPVPAAGAAPRERFCRSGCVAWRWMR